MQFRPGFIIFLLKDDKWRRGERGPASRLRTSTEEFGELLRASMAETNSLDASANANHRSIWGGRDSW